MLAICYMGAHHKITFLAALCFSKSLHFCFGDRLLMSCQGWLSTHYETLACPKVFIFLPQPLSARITSKRHHSCFLLHPILISLNLILCVYFACMHGCAPRVCLVIAEARIGCQMP